MSWRYARGIGEGNDFQVGSGVLAAQDLLSPACHQRGRQPCPVSRFVAKVPPAVDVPLCRQPSMQQVPAGIRQYRDEQMGPDAILPEMRPVTAHKAWSMDTCQNWAVSMGFAFPRRVHGRLSRAIPCEQCTNRADSDRPCEPQRRQWSSGPPAS